MKNQIRKRSEGFTIIEVLIVLAIAGLIMLIVFLAVPALQRNSRNTQRKNDIAAILGAVNEWSNNNNGKIPDNQTTLDTALENANLGVYDGEVNFHDGAFTNPADTDSVTLAVKAKCGGDEGDDAVAGSSRSIVALYTVETGGVDDPICTES